MENIIDFSKTKPTIEMPYLLKVQKESYEDLKNRKLGEILAKIFPIETKKITLEFVSYFVSDPIKSMEDCLRIGSTYEARINATFRLTYKETGEIIEQSVYLADIPVMTPEGCFIINGRKRVVVQQLLRSPGVFFQLNREKDSGIINYVVTMIPDHGTWMDMEVGKDNVIYMRLKKKMRKIPLSTVLKVIGFSSNEEILSTFNRTMSINIITKAESSYQVAFGKVLVEDVKNEKNGKILLKKGTRFTEKALEILSKNNIERITLKLKGVDYWIEQTIKRDRNSTTEQAMMDIYKIVHPKERITLDGAKSLVEGLLINPTRNSYIPVGRHKINMKFGTNIDSPNLTKEDFINIVNYLIDIREGIKKEDDIDNLMNRRVRTVGELIGEEIERGLIRVQRNVKDRITISQKDRIKLSEIINAKTISGQLRQFFGTNQLSQFMEETNPLSAIAHKRRLSSLGPGGLHRKRAGVEVRDVHHSHYSRICPVETPEGQNIGLINSLASYAKIDDLGFIIAPYRKVEKGRVKDEIIELTPADEEKYIIAQANTPVDKNGVISTDSVIAREKSESGEIIPQTVDRSEVELMDIVPQQVIGVAASLIPFLEHDDATRVLMGCNMQRQAVPLIDPDLPRVATGIEKRVPLDNGDLQLAEEDGIVSLVTGSHVYIVPDDAKAEEVSVYKEVRELKINLLNMVKQKEILLFDYKPRVEGLNKYVGDRLVSSVIEKLITKGIEEISIIEVDKLQKFPIKKCFELEKNEQIVGMFAAETIMSKKNKPIIEEGQKISDTKLSRLFNSKIKKIKVKEDDQVVNKPVFSINLTAIGKNIVGKWIFATFVNTKRTKHIGSEITEELLKKFYEKGITDFLIYSNDDVKTFFLGKLNLDVVDLIAAKDYVVKKGRKKEYILNKEEIITADTLKKLAEAGITKIKIKKGKVYKLKKFYRTNQDTCRNEHPIVKKGQHVRKGEPIADSYATKNTELALGINVLVAYIPWYGYNYQDAVVISRRLVSEDRLTSIHVKEYNIDVHETDHGDEELTADPPDVSREAKRFLDENGIVRVGSKVGPGDILVGKTTPFPEEDETSEARLFRTLFDNRPANIKNSSFKVPPGEGGVVVSVRRFAQEDGYELARGVKELIKVHVSRKRKIIVGDKVSGRHGNKGVVSNILPEEDLPYLDDGTTVDVILSPLSVPSRMNLGQILEANIGIAAKKLNVRVITPIFNGAGEKEIKGLLKEAKLPESGQFTMYDGRTGKPFDYKVTLGDAYLLKLNHLAEDKMHARSVGKYTLITQQPVGGKAQFGGQRLGEMEVWALEAYGASDLLHEMLTIKSDDLEGRKHAYEEISKGNTVLMHGIPESFNVLQRELRGLVLDLKVLPEKKGERPKREKIISKKEKVELTFKKKEEESSEVI